MTPTRLPRAAKLLIAGDALSSLGTGLVLPLTLIYLHQVRGIALPVVGVLLAGSAAVGLVSVPLSGMAIDRFMAPTVPPLINSLAGERIRGRANALSSAAYSLAFVVSPTISTGLIAAGLPAAWIGLLCAGCLGTVALGARLGRRLSRDQDRVAPAAPAVEPAPV